MLTSLPIPESWHRDPLPSAKERRENILRLERMVAGGYPVEEGLIDFDEGVEALVKAKDGEEAGDLGEETPSVRFESTNTAKPYATTLYSGRTKCFCSVANRIMVLLRYKNGLKAMSPGGISRNTALFFFGAFQPPVAPLRYPYSPEQGAQ